MVTTFINRHVKESEQSRIILEFRRLRYTIDDVIQHTVTVNPGIPGQNCVVGILRDCYLAAVLHHCMYLTVQTRVGLLLYYYYILVLETKEKVFANYVRQTSAIPLLYQLCIGTFKSYHKAQTMYLNILG